jgi:hypothetical protein
MARGLACFVPRRPAVAGAAGAGRARAHAQQGRRGLAAGLCRARDLHERARPRVVLRRHGAQQERAVGADAGAFVVFSLMAVLWCVYGYSFAFTEGNAYIGGFDRLFLKGTFDSAKGEFAMARHVLQEHADPGAAVRRVPGHVRGDHLCPHPGRVRRAREVLGGAALHRAVVHVRLHADRAHGVVLGRPGRLHGIRRSSTVLNAKAGYDLAVGRARLRGRHRGAHQRRYRGPGGCLLHRQARGLRQAKR